MGHHRKTTQEDTDHKDSEAPVMWFPWKTGSRNTTTLPSTLVWWTKWKFQICLKGSMFWVGDGSLGYQSLADFLGNFVTALGRRFCGWKKLQVFLNGLCNILSHLVTCFPHFSIPFNEDCEMTKQIWSNCADVTIKKSGKATKAFSPERGGGIDEVTIESSEWLWWQDWEGVMILWKNYVNDATLMPYCPYNPVAGCSACCVERGLCSNCSKCVNDKEGACAYCWKPLTWWEDRSLAVSNQSHRWWIISR